MDMLRKSDQYWQCHAACPCCHTYCLIDWATVAKSEGMGYRMSCTSCGKPFDFVSWQYTSACPICQLEFTALMHTTVSDSFAYQRQCDGCNSPLEFRRNSPPQSRAVRRQDLIVIDAPSGAARGPTPVDVKRYVTKIPPKRR